MIESFFVAGASYLLKSPDLSRMIPGLPEGVSTITVAPLEQGAEINIKNIINTAKKNTAKKGETFATSQQTLLKSIRALNVDGIDGFVFESKEKFQVGKSDILRVRTADDSGLGFVLGDQINTRTQVEINNSGEVRVFEFNRLENGQTAVTAFGKDSKGRIHQVFCPVTQGSQTNTVLLSGSVNGVITVGRCPEGEIPLIEVSKE
jgi:hypothetical protein